MAAPDTEIGRWFRQTGGLLALFRRTEYRRDVYTLFVMSVRRVVTWRFVLTSLLMAGAGFFMAWYYAASPRMAFECLQGGFALMALAAGAMLYSEERDAGTLELLWLATGSERALLRMKLGAVMTALFVLILPSTLLAAWWFEGFPPATVALLFFLTNAFFVLAVMAWLGTWFPQPWSAALLGIGLLGTVYISFGGQVTLLNPFLNLVPGGAQRVAAGQWISNRIFMVMLSLVLLRMSAARLRRTFNE